MKKSKTEELEFEKVYNLKVVQIPTHQPIKRKDFSDLVYKNQNMKWKAIATECIKMYKIGRPVLVGTTTIENSEFLASLLKEYKLPYQLLNAKPENIKYESEILAQAGCRNTVTIATNMVGRGTDIVLGGNSEILAAFIIKSQMKALLKTKIKIQNKFKKKDLNSQLIQSMINLNETIRIKNIFSGY